MKKEIITALLGAALVSPAIAQSSGGSQPGSTQAQPGQSQSSQDTYRRASPQGAPAVPANDVEYSRSMERLFQAAQRLREAVQAMAQQPPGEQRNRAMEMAREALLETQSAMVQASAMNQSASSGQSSTGQSQTPQGSQAQGQQQRLRQQLQQAGFQDVQILDATYLVQARAPDGHTVMMLVNPPMAPTRNSSGQGQPGSSASGPATQPGGGSSGGTR
ncbi:hypothetical protein [Sabulicella glaciei]|uniref:Uncharacterized protein n=1 Tax=Sabulicella glaciei TaxID=2984948 RepID=A0ABT3P246_9PROT|nr:hypothetical protein [Roseococcus sp. MDT2-1-1]MCW8088488.1 hypothetical protein [Roseococcus sp. MDT2-1-1]